MAAGSTYSQIASTTLGSATSSYTFSSIPQTYTNLVVVVNGGSSSNNIDFDMVINGDNGNNYSRTLMYGNGSSAGSTRYSNEAYLSFTYYGNMTTNFSWIGQININNYANTTTYKTILGKASNADTYGVNATVGLWRSTSAITSIQLKARASNFITGTTFSLYGIKGA